MKHLLFILILITAAAAKPRQSNRDILGCLLTADKSIYKIGEVPIFTVKIYNKTNKDIYLIGSLDASDVKWRYPYCYFTIDKPNPDTIPQLRCGNMNGLRLGDFVLVKPGREFNPYDETYGFFPDYTTMDNETFKNSGVYKIKFHYSTNPKDIADFLGDRSPRMDQSDSLKINSLLKSVPKVDIASNEIQFKVEE